MSSCELDLQIAEFQLKSWDWVDDRQAYVAPFDCVSTGHVEGLRRVDCEREETELVICRWSSQTELIGIVTDADLKRGARTYKQ